VFSLLASWSKAQENKSVPTQEPPAQGIESQKKIRPLYYRFKDQELPFTIVAGEPMGRFMGMAAFPRRNLGVSIFLFDETIDEKYLDNSGYGFAHEGGIILDSNQAPNFYIHDVNRGLDFRPTHCFQDAQPYKDGYKVNLNLLQEQDDGSYKKGELPALMYVNHITFRDSGGDAEPEDYPGGAFEEVHVLLPELSGLYPQGLPQNQKFLIKVEYPAIFPKDPPNLKAAKYKMIIQLCQAIKTFSWVDFRGGDFPPQWGRSLFQDDPQGREWPSPEISK
ncbi:MAG: hypothetical protein HY547_09505, partial [Elusimicrobia bacterium]|nr:hypothetical protein [Elusimicrobiota bacterium]